MEVKQIGANLVNLIIAILLLLGRVNFGNVQLTTTGLGNITLTPAA